MGEENNVTNPAVKAGLLYWLSPEDCGKPSGTPGAWWGGRETPRRPVEAGVLGEYSLCREVERRGVAGTTYTDVVIERAFLYLEPRELCGKGVDVSVGLRESAGVSEWGFGWVMERLKAWLEASLVLPLHYHGGGRGPPAGLVVHRPACTPRGGSLIPLSALLIFTYSSGSLEIAQQALVEGVKRALGGRGRLWGVEPWESLQGFRLSLAWGLRVAGDWGVLSRVDGGGGWFNVGLPLVLAVVPGGVPGGLERKLESLAIVAGKLLYSRRLANLLLGEGERAFIVRPLTTFTTGELETYFPDPRGLAESVLGGEARSRVRSLGELAARYSYVAPHPPKGGGGGELLVFPSLHHYSNFISHLVEEYSKLVRAVVGRNPPGLARKIRVGGSSILNLMLQVEDALSTLIAQKPLITGNRMELEKNLRNLEHVLSRLGMERGSLGAGIRRVGEDALLEFTQLEDRVDTAIETLNSMVALLRDHEEAASRIVQERLNDLITILTAAGLYQILNPIIGRALGKEEPVLASALTVAVSVLLPVSLRVLEYMRRRRIYKR